MGNFSISHYAGLTIERNSIEVRYLIDMAEIPTFQEMQLTGITAQLDDPRLAAYLAGKATELASGLTVSVDGQPVELRVVNQNVIFPPGAGNLPTMKFGFVYRGEFTGNCAEETCRLEYEDSNFSGRAGWKEIIALAGSGVVLESSTAPGTDRSAQLSNYPTDLLNSPPQDLRANIVFSAARTNGSALASQTTTSNIGPMRHANGPSANTATQSAPGRLPAEAAGDRSGKIEVKANEQTTPRNAFTELMATKHLSFSVAWIAALIAIGLGALHALEPGHGKTIVAAYLVGAKGTARHAVFLGTIVTISHTAGVYLLGGVTLYAQKYIVPEQLYPWLGVLSGLLIAGMGGYLFLQRYGGATHGHTHSHGHGPFEHTHGPFGHLHVHAYAAGTGHLRTHESDGHQHPPPDWHDHLHDHPHQSDHSNLQAHAHNDAHGIHEHADGTIHSHAHSREHSHPHVSGQTMPAAPDAGKKPSAAQLLVLGITGGMIPCPAALVVLLSAVALHRVGFGLFLIVAFSLGLAAVLIAMGLAAVYAGRLMSRIPRDGALIQRWLPLTSAAMITILGWVIVIRGLIAAGIVQIRL